MKRIIIALIFFWGSLSMGAVVVRQHTATIQPDLPILATDLNDEFNALVAGINGIDSTNVTGGSLTQTNFAATSTAISLNKRTGCRMRPATDITLTGGVGLSQVSIEPPCEIFMDGVRGFITATQTIALTTNMDNGLTPNPKTFYFVYATRNNSSLLFEFSANAPDITTARMAGTAATQTGARYIGTVRTLDQSNTAGSNAWIANFIQDGNHGYWSQDTVVPNILLSSGSTVPQQGLVGALTTATASVTLTVPQHFVRGKFRYRGFPSAFPAGCNFNFSGFDLSYQSVVVATGNNNNVGIVPYWIRIASENSAVRSIPAASMANNSGSCFLGDLTLMGWEEPLTLYQ